MKYRTLINYAFLFLLTFLTACSTTSTTPVDNTPDPLTLKVATSFLNNIEAGKLALLGFNQSIVEQAKSNPGLAEVMSRVFSDIDDNFFVGIAAPIYAKHLPYETLEKIDKHSERESIQRFFKIIFEKIGSGEKIDNKALASQFNADELIEIIKLGSSDAFNEMKTKLPTINNEIAVQSKLVGEKMMLDFIKNN